MCVGALNIYFTENGVDPLTTELESISRSVATSSVYSVIDWRSAVDVGTALLPVRLTVSNLQDK